ncbi:spore germination protein [Paramaledivibacter caminithermalis]|jgi:spore germination protein KA|uniref:Spore germination protein KA n=1 Tax=Paramaledivibacter caminithermalis (strain DSM 15212 / CIP 107654 / DViRD3) TaxID=1121301 RepID=A0A1M6JJL8_PARC5|nr:spore germination protein [Paramaledivibacter caminithermalis]SHJ46907.1 spore germination protein KA [Paramaledivibacter caminithermalis DSM 15212]
MFIKFLKKCISKNKIQKNTTSIHNRKTVSEKTVKIHKDIKANLENIKNSLNNTSDLVIRELYIGLDNPVKAFICFINGFVNEQRLSKNIKYLVSLQPQKVQDYKSSMNFDLIDLLKERILDIPSITETNNLNEIISSLLSSEAAIFIAGYETALLLDIDEYETRAIEKPDTEVSIRGSQEGFTESLDINMTLIRRRIRSPKLVFEKYTMGKDTNTRIQLAYMKGIVDKEILKYVKGKLSRLKFDAVLETGYLEQELEENKFALFATIGNTEKPDKAAAKLLEGRIAILCDGTPMVLTVPHLFIEAFQTTEDYYSRPLLPAMLRLIRYFAFFISLTMPGLYIAFTSYHQEMIPTILLVTIMASREAIPFPVFIETSIMMIIFEILRESGVRLPRKVGQAVSIVGALIIGEAAVNAGILSSPMVIIGSITGITSFMVPPLLDGLIFYRTILILLSSVLGLYGFAIGMLSMLAHLCSLKSFGANYFAPFAPTKISELKATLTRESKPSKLIKSQSLTSTIDQKRNNGGH